MYSVSGNFELPPDKKNAEFSKTNWGDYFIGGARGDKLVKRATVFLRTIRQLKPQQWDDIFKAALAFTSKQPMLVKTEEPESETESEEDLVDPRYASAPPEGGISE